MAQLSLTHTIITDAGSVKGHLLEAAQTVFGELPPLLVLGHPIAGSERSGVEAANPSLFKHHKVIFAPHATTHTAQTATMEVQARQQARQRKTAT